MNKTFCVYEHWRPDTDECFYVGKGSRRRARYLHRKENQHHRRIVDKLARDGLRANVRLIKVGLSENDAFAEEVERIAFWRKMGARLVNRTEGGEGASGCERSAEFRAKISRAFKGRPGRTRGTNLPAEHRANISKGLKGRRISPETRAKISAAQKGKPRPELVGRKISDAGIERLRNRVFSDEHRLKISLAKRGKPKSPEHREKLAAASRAAAARRRAHLNNGISHEQNRRCTSAQI